MTGQLVSVEGAHAGPISPGSVPIGPAPTEQYFGRRAWRIEDYQAEACGFRLAESDELPAAHKLSETVMGMQLAPLWALASAHLHTGGTCWVHDDFGQAQGEGVRPALSGVFLLLPLNWDGEAALRTERFSFAAPRLDHLCAPGDEMAAMYFWLCVGADAAARRAVMQTAQAWFDGACFGHRVYGRAASELGVRAFANFGFRRLAPETPQLFILDQRR